MWRPCLALLLAASASALRGRGVVDAEGPHHEKWRKALKTGRDIVDSKGPHHEKWRKALKVPLGHGHKHKDKEEHEHKEPSRDEHKHEHEHKERPTEAPQTCNPANATEPAAEIQGAKRSATCGPFPGQQVVLVTVSEDFMPFFKNWLHYARPFLTSSEQVVAFAEDEDVVPLLRRFLHEANGTRFKIAVPANRAQTAWNVTMARDRSYLQDVYEIRVQDVHPFGSKGYKKVVSQRPRQIRHFLEQGCSVLYADIDTAWLKNPFHEISRAGNFEMYVTDDATEDKGLASNYLCSCFLYMHPTSKVKAVMNRWEFLLEGELQRNQWRFNKAFHEISNCFPDFAVALPRKEFPPGCHSSSDPTVLHANYMMEPLKQTFLEKHGAWSLK